MAEMSANNHQEKAFAAPLGASTLSEDHWEEILDHSPEVVGWTDSENYHYYTISKGKGTLTTSGEAGVYQVRSGGKIIQHIFLKGTWNRVKAWSYLEGLAEKSMREVKDMDVEFLTSFRAGGDLGPPDTWTSFDLVEDIEKNGIQTPLILSITPDSKYILLTQGTHRLAAATRLKMHEVPVEIVVKDILHPDFVHKKELSQEDLESIANLFGRLQKVIKLRLEEMNPVKLAELDEVDLDEDHTRLHQYYQEWLDGEHRDQEGGDWSFGDLFKAHIFVVDELKNRGKKCEFDDKLAKGPERKLVAVLNELKSEYKQFEGFLIWDDEIHDPIKIIFKEAVKLED